MCILKLDTLLCLVMIMYVRSVNTILFVAIFIAPCFETKGSNSGKILDKTPKKLAFKCFSKYLVWWWPFSAETCCCQITTNNCVDGLYLFEFMSAVLLSFIGDILFKRYTHNAANSPWVLLKQYREGSTFVSLNKLYLHTHYKIFMTLWRQRTLLHGVVCFCYYYNIFAWIWALKTLQNSLLNYPQTWCKERTHFASYKTEMRPPCCQYSHLLRREQDSCDLFIARGRIASHPLNNSDDNVPV